MRIVWNAFSGWYADSPRALHRGMLDRGVDAEHVWLAMPSQLSSFPAGTTTVPFGGPAATDALEAADLIVSNVGLGDRGWTKRADTLYLQTWHGTPLKRIHYDEPVSPPDRALHHRTDLARWDLLVSPNRASTPRLVGAFGFEGEVLETGYPQIGRAHV